MECVSCKESADEAESPQYVLSNICYHGLCSMCFESLVRISGSPAPPCPQCREPMSDVMKEVHPETFKMVCDRSYRPAGDSSFDALFSRDLRPTYELLRSMIYKRWGHVAAPKLSPLCAVCVAAATHGISDEEMALLNLFYACAPVTRQVVEDALTVLHLRFGLEVCHSITPKDVYYHFFLKMCDLKSLSATANWTRTRRKLFTGGENLKRDNPAADENANMAAHRVLVAMHELLYDTTDIDSLAQTLGLLSDPSSCGCNEVQSTVKTIVEQHERKKNKKGGDGEDDDFFIAAVEETGVSESIGLDVVADNDYRWEMECVKNNKNDDVGDSEFVVDCLGVFLDCPVCTQRLSSKAAGGVYSDEILSEIKTGLTRMNVETSVYIVGRKRRLPAAAMEHLVNHFTEPRCRLNDDRFVPLMTAVVKHTEALKNPAFVNHLYKELFGHKYSSVCPVYHLAVLCTIINKRDSTKGKLQKRDVVQKKANAILRSHSTARK